MSIIGKPTAKNATVNKAGSPSTGVRKEAATGSSRYDEAELWNDYKENDNTFLNFREVSPYM